MSQKLSEIQITVRGRQFSCPRLSSEHAIFFGTLLMDEEELRVYIDGEDPSAAMDMMQARLIASSEKMSELLSQADLSSEEITQQINDEQVQKIVQRLIVRINQDQMPGNLIQGIRYKVANRLREVFPEFPLEWVSPTSINLEVEELVTAIAIPLFGTMASAAEKAKADQPEAKKPKEPKGNKGFKAEVQRATPKEPEAQIEASTAIEVIPLVEPSQTPAEDAARKARILNLQSELAALGAPVKTV